MQYRAITLHLPESLLSAAEAAAHGQAITVAQLLRQALAGQVGHDPAADQARLHRVLSLKARLSGDFTDARGWADLGRRLRAKGYGLSETVGGLWLVALPDQTPLCSLSDLGFTLPALIRRFGTGFPAPQHGWLSDRLAGAEYDGEEDFDVIDRTEDWTSARPQG